LAEGFVDEDEAPQILRSQERAELAVSLSVLRGVALRRREAFFFRE
jgi:hypothetical protein